MAMFIEHKSNPRWIALYVFCGALVIPLLAGTLLVLEVVSTIGMVVIVACGMGGIFLLNEQVERRSRKVTEVASGNMAMRPSWTVDHTVLEFREDADRRTALLIASIIMVIMVLFLLGSLTTTYGTKGAWAAVSLVLAVSPAALMLAAFWASSMRLRIEGDQVQVIYPFLRGWRNRAFRFGEIASVEVRVVDKGAKQVCIRLHDGSSVRYVTSNETMVDELLEVLKRGVSEAKPAKQDWSELP